MKVSIFGSYNGSSIGDTAILLGLISSIFRVLGDDVEITVITFGSIGINEELAELGIKKRVKEISANRGFPDYSYGIGELLNRSWRYVKRIQRKSILNEGRVREGLRGSDILLIGGGNLVMDLYESWPRALMSVCNVSNNLHIPYGFIGVGSAPINTAQGKKNLLASLELSSGVCFRDSASKEYCAEHLKFYRSSVGPDLAFGIECPSVTQTDKADVLLVNLAGVYSECWPVKDQDKYSAYLSNMVDVVDRLVESLSIKELVVFNTNYPLDEIASEDFLNKYRDSSRAPVPLSLVRGRHTVASLLRICSQAKYSLVTRLHADRKSVV